MPSNAARREETSIIPAGPSTPRERWSGAIHFVTVQPAPHTGQMPFSWSSSQFLLALAAITLVGCGEANGAGGAEPTGSAEQHIYGGQLAKTCQWPTTVYVSNGNSDCTGTLVHPLIVVTAGHCFSDGEVNLIALADDGDKPVRELEIDSCKAFTKKETNPVAADYAYCKLKNPVTDVPIAPILMGCETDILKKDQKIVLAGFGMTSASSSSVTKHWVETTVTQADDQGGILLGGNGKDTCNGDSGGPAFVQLADKSWRVFGITSQGNACGEGSEDGMIHKTAPWIEQQSGVDITPCQDADGTWNPSPSCTGFSLDPAEIGRSWDHGCAETALSGPSSTCGAGIDTTPVDAGGAEDAGQPPGEPDAAAGG